jgi:outer membrane protein, heavy metal efflux system
MRTIVCVALAVCIPSAAGAQIVLTEAEALARLSVESPRVRALRGQIEVARADILAAGRLPNPRVTLSRESVAGIAEDYLTVTQPLPVTGRRGLEIQSAEAALRATEFRAADLEHRARAELRRAFAMLRQSQAREEDLTAALLRLRELSDVLARREAAGDAAGFDRLRAEREVLDLEADRAEAAIARASAQATLAGFFAPAVNPRDLRAAPASAPPRSLASLEHLLARAESSRGELLALAQDAEAAVFARKAADRRNVPEPEVVAGLKTSNAAGSDRGSVISLVATVALFDRARPEKARAEARERQARAQLEAERLRVRAEVAGLRQAVVERRAIANTYRSAAVAHADELQRIARVSYEAGERGILELLDAYRSAIAARTRLAGLEALAAQAEIELEYATASENLK